MKKKPIRDLIAIVAIAAVLISAGCIEDDRSAAPTPTPARTTTETPLPASTPTSPPTDPILEGKIWTLTLIAGGDGDVHPPIPGTTITASFENGTISGTAGCNQYFGTYTVADNIVINEMLWTEMFCESPEGVMEQETQYLDILRDVTTYTIPENQLTLGTEDGRALVYHAELATTTRSKGAMSVSELLESPVYDTEVKVYGIVNHLGQLFCPCFALYSDRKTLNVQYDMMWEDDGTKRPAVSVEGIENGNWVIVTGELKSSTGTAPSTTFQASNIEKMDAPLAPFSSLQDCQSGCVEAGFEKGECKLPTEVGASYFILGPCVIPSSKHCGDEGQCNCYCYNITRPKPDIKEEEALI
jgi:heat shock protein HslJ